MSAFTVGVRYDYAIGQPDAFSGPTVSYDWTTDSLRDERNRVSAALTYYPSEFSKVRLQYNYDRSPFLTAGAAHSLWLQAEILFGAHGAHKF